MRMRRIRWFVAGLTVIADQLTKSLVVQSFTLGQSLPLLPPLVHLAYVQNTGAEIGRASCRERV